MSDTLDLKASGHYVTCPATGAAGCRAALPDERVAGAGRLRQHAAPGPASGQGIRYRPGLRPDGLSRAGVRPGDGGCLG